MMRVLVDSNLMLELFLNRSNYVKDAERLLKIILFEQHIKFYITDKCLHNIVYYLSKDDEQVGTDAERWTKKLVKNFILPIDNDLVTNACTSSLKHWDSVIELECAVKENIGAIVTLNPEDFAGANLRILSVDNLLELSKLKYLEKSFTENYFSNLDSLLDKSSVVPKLNNISATKPKPKPKHISQNRQQNQNTNIKSKTTEIDNSKPVNSLKGKNLYCSNLRNADLEEKDISLADLGLADLSNSNLTSANLFRTILTRADLNHALLLGANLHLADLNHALLLGANLSDAVLIRANMNYCNLAHTNLYKSKLCASNLTFANLFRADLSCSDLSFANLNNADLTCTNLTDAVVKGTQFGNNKGIDKYMKAELIERGAIFLGNNSENSRITTSVLKRF